MNRLEGKTAFITGSARGIGRAFAEAYLREGAAHVVIADINLERAQADRQGTWRRRRTRFASTLQTRRRSTQLSARRSTSLAASTCSSTMPHCSIWQPIVEITRESYDKLFAVNFSGTLFTLQAVAKAMIARGKGGKIINMASQAGRRGEPLVAIYCATKAAVISLTQSAGLNLIEHGINVNAIAPGVVDGEHWEGVDALFAKYENRPRGEKKRLVGEAVPYGRMGTAEDLTGMAIFLASSESDYVVAQTYNVDGGNWMS